MIQPFDFTVVIKILQNNYRYQTLLFHIFTLLLFI